MNVRRGPGLDRPGFGAKGSVFDSQKVNGLYNFFMAEAWRVSLYPGWFRSYEARMRVLGPTAGIRPIPLDRGPGDDA